MEKTSRWRSPVVPSAALSLTAAGLLVWHVFGDPAEKIDGWAVTLLVVLFLPWLGAIFETIEFPGGGKVQWRKKVEAEQQRQAGDIEALQFLLARFLTDEERELLQRLAGDEPVHINSYDGGRLAELVRSLGRLTPIAEKPSYIAIKEELTKSGESREISLINQVYELTDRGRKYLELATNLPDIKPGNRAAVAGIGQ